MDLLFDSKNILKICMVERGLMLVIVSFNFMIVQFRLSDIITELNAIRRKLA